MPEREPVQLTSLDAAFDEAMKAMLEGTRVAASAPSADATVAAFAYLRDHFGLLPLTQGAPLAPENTAGLGGWFRRLARRFFVSRTYHATLVTLLAEVARRQREAEASVESLELQQSAQNERTSRVLFRLWGDYNHLVRVVLDHHLNRVFAAFEDHFGAFEKHFGAFERNFQAYQENFKAFQEHFSAYEANFAAFQEHFAAHDRTVRELTDSVRTLERTVHEIAAPHDELVRSVAELLAGRGRDEVLARRIEALEESSSRTSDGQSG